MICLWEGLFNRNSVSLRLTLQYWLPIIELTPSHVCACPRSEFGFDDIGGSVDNHCLYAYLNDDFTFYESICFNNGRIAVFGECVKERTLYKLRLRFYLSVLCVYTLLLIWIIKQQKVKSSFKYAYKLFKM
jgi:hypothetical protein